jgi:hypothetical protein
MRPFYLRRFASIVHAILIFVMTIVLPKL